MSDDKVNASQATKSQAVTSQMNAADICEYAKRLIEQHGDKAEATAASKTQEKVEQRNDKEQAGVWRRIRAAIHEQRPAHQS